MVRPTTEQELELRKKVSEFREKSKDECEGNILSGLAEMIEEMLMPSDELKEHLKVKFNKRVYEMVGEDPYLREKQQPSLGLLLNLDWENNDKKIIELSYQMGDIDDEREQYFNNLEQRYGYDYEKYIDGYMLDYFGYKRAIVVAELRARKFGQGTLLVD